MSLNPQWEGRRPTTLGSTRRGGPKGGPPPSSAGRPNLVFVSKVLAQATIVRQSSIPFLLYYPHAAGYKVPCGFRYALGGSHAVFGFFFILRAFPNRQARAGQGAGSPAGAGQAQENR